MAHVDFLHGGNIYEIERKYRKEVIDFSANINPLGLPLKIKKTIYKNSDKILHYPDPEAMKVTQKIANYWGINEKNILLGNGSVELIYLVVSTFKPKITLIPVPTFSEYERATKSVKSKIQFLTLKEKEGFRFSLPHFNKVDIFFLCNPNNPTGNLILENLDTIEKFDNKLLVIDEAFMDFLPDEKKHTLIWKAQKNKRIIVLRTFTKFFALPGLRIGYLVAHQDVIAKLRQHQIPWSVNFFAQLVAELILSDREYIRKTKQFIEDERKFLFDAVANIRKLIPFPSVANFLLVKIGNKTLTSTSLKKKLIQEGILIRDCANFRGLNNRFIRIAVRSRKENLKLIRALKTAINKCSKRNFEHFDK